MAPLRKLIESLRVRGDIGVVDETHAWRLVVTKGRYLFCEISVPYEVLEWHACVKDRREGREVWSDWMDYTGYDQRPREILEAEMAGHILAFVDRVSISEPLVLPLRIYEEKIS